MNPNIEYEKFVQEVYQRLVNTDTVKAIDIKHDILITGKSGQAHQIDVYWEYEIAGTKQKVVIECKNYNKPISIGKVRDFFGVIYDLSDVIGIMVTKKGYQKGAKGYGQFYGIELKELRVPSAGEAIIGEVNLNINTSVQHRLFLVDEEDSGNSKFNVTAYKQKLDSLYFNRDNRWQNSTHIPFELLNQYIKDDNGKIISSFEEIEKDLPEDEIEYTQSFQNAYIETRYFGKLRIREIKYESESKSEQKVISIDAQEFTRAILKDALTNEIRFIVK